MESFNNQKEDESIPNKDENKKENYSQYIIFLLAMNLVLLLITKIFSSSDFFPYPPETKRIVINDGKSLKMGIISDFQLENRNDKLIITRLKSAPKNLHQTLTVFKKHNIDLIIIAGDISHNGLSSNFILYRKIFYSVYHNSKKKPKVISLMGNHDYLNISLSITERQKQYYTLIGDYPSSHYIINNYHFIFWGNDNEKIQDLGINDTRWINNELEFAKKNLYKKGDPIFVFTHMHPLGTVYGSENIWGSKKIFDTLKNYSEVICFSGHSHYSLRNDRSIWQNEFTVINTQSISYVDLDNYFINSNEVRNISSSNSYMGIIAKLNENKIIMERIYFMTEQILKDKWIINFPINKENFDYTLDKLSKNIKPPFFEESNKIEYDESKRLIKFLSAIHERYVYCYRLILKNSYNKEIVLKYYSDYYILPKLRKKEVELYIPININSGDYNIEIYAVDSFGQESKPLLYSIKII